MKKINSIEELTEGQEVYIKARVYLDNDPVFPIDLILNSNNDLIGITKDFKHTVNCRKDSSIQIFTAEPGNSEQLQLPEIGKEYEFKFKGSLEWQIGVLKDVKYLLLKNGKGEIVYEVSEIRPIKQSQEEINAIELLKSLGYTKIEK